MSDTHKQYHPQHFFQYTALGNSIAFGVGATNHYGYVHYFRDFLATQHQHLMFINRADSGFTSRDLLHQLKYDETTREAVKNANLITISIGGANLLNCINTANLPDCLSNAAATFANDWPQILNEIRKGIRSDAEIYVMTVYNPFRGNDPNSNLVESFIQQINHVINNHKYRSFFHYKVVDVHSDFQGRFANGRWKVCTWTHFCQFPPDPHPTNNGHLEIARLHQLAYLKYHRDKL